MPWARRPVPARPGGQWAGRQLGPVGVEHGDLVECLRVKDQPVRPVGRLVFTVDLLLSRRSVEALSGACYTGRGRLVDLGQSAESPQDVRNPLR
jgi:hypothetical protein